MLRHMTSAVFCAMLCGSVAAAQAQEALPPTDVEYLSDAYQVARKTRVTNGVSKEYWTVRYDHSFVRCPRPTQESCVGALQDYDARSRRDRGS